jgi:hypothetical protein
MINMLAVTLTEVLRDSADEMKSLAGALQA